MTRGPVRCAAGKVRPRRRWHACENRRVRYIIIGAGAQSVSDQMWVVKKDSTLTGIKDLAGKKIAFTAPGSVSNMVILMALKANGITPQQVKLVPVFGHELQDVGGEDA